MTVALKNPDMVQNLIPVDNAPVDVALKSDFRRYVDAMKKIDAAKVEKQAAANTILESVEESEAVRLFLLTNLTRSESGDGKTTLHFRIPLDILSKSLDNMGDFPYKDPDTHRFEKNALFIRGTKSHYVADESLPVIGRFFPRFELRDIEAGHWVISENPHAFKEAVQEWLSDKL